MYLWTRLFPHLHPLLPHAGGGEIGEMNTGDGRDGEKVDTKNGL